MMRGRLKAYDGFVQNIHVSHGLVVLKESVVLKEGAIRSSDDCADTSADLSPAFADPSRQFAVKDILDRASAVIGSREEAMRWMGTPVRALNYATPISLLVDDAGEREVIAVLENLEHGVL